MADPDAALDALKETMAEFAEFCASQGQVSETDTRVKLIDRILTDVCGWPENQLVRESHVESGFIDYTLKLLGKATVAVEAKREGIAFTLPVDGTRRSYKLSGALMTDRDTAAA